MNAKALVYLVALVTSMSTYACPKANSNSDKTLDAAQKARAAGKSGDADRLLGSILAADPDNVRALYLQGLIRIDQKEYPAAEQAIGKAASVQELCAASITSSDFSVYNTLGWVQMVQGKTKDAEVNYKKAIDGIGNSNPQALSQAKSNLGALYFAQGRFGEAEPILTAARAGGSQNAARKLEQLTTAQAEVEKQLVPRVYVHVASSAPKETGEAAVKALKGWNYNVPPLQIVSFAPKNNEVRYFHDDDKAAAEALAAQFATANLGTYNVKELDAATPTFTVPKKQLEVWVAH